MTEKEVRTAQLRRTRRANLAIGVVALLAGILVAIASIWIGGGWEY
jgi:hypothetical protein